MLKTILFVAVGGAVGSVFRYLTTFVISKYFATAFPLATFVSNIVGCFLIGFILGLLEKHQLSNSNLKWLLVTGFCGGYTTFSAFGYENIALFQNQNPALAFGYIGASIFGGLLAVWVGLFVSQ